MWGSDEQRLAGTVKFGVCRRKGDTGAVHLHHHVGGSAHFSSRQRNLPFPEWHAQHSGRSQKELSPGFCIAQYNAVLCCTSSVRVAQMKQEKTQYCTVQYCAEEWCKPCKLSKKAWKVQSLVELCWYMMTLYENTTVLYCDASLRTFCSHLQPTKFSKGVSRSS